MEWEDGPIAGFLEALNSHALESIQTVLTPDFTFEEVAGPGQRSVDALTAEMDMVFTAFPDISFRPVRQSGADGRTYVEFRAVGTHRGEFVGVPPTGTLAIVSGVFNCEIADGGIKRLRLTVDFGGLRRQLLVAGRVESAS